MLERSVRSLALLLGLSGLAVVPGLAQAPSGAVALDPRVVEQWFDSLVGPAIKTSGIPGAVVVVVNRAGIVLNKGYGVSDVAAQTPVQPEVTLFETASIGKSMTALITAQLIAEGVLDPDRDINEYLKSARVTGPKVTLRILLTHRGGFDDDITGLFSRFDGDIRIPTAELNRRFHPLVEPGFAVAYDNQGFGVIGILLRDVTGKSVPELYRERLFEPAGMTGAAHGRPADGKARLAKCYTVQGPGAVHECEYWLYRDGLMGAGGVAMSGLDMARYMRLLLNGGTLEGREVISPRAFADVIDFSHARFHPGMPGGGYAFVQFEEFRGLEYAHSGHMPGFSTMMKIYPDADVGIFVTFLGGTPPSFDLTMTNIFQSLSAVNVRPEAKPGFGVMNDITDTFADRFIPAGRPRSSEGPALNQPDSTAKIEDFLGRYVIGSNHSRSLFSNIGGWTGLLTLERGSGTNVRLGGDYAALGEYHQVGPLLYENDKGARLALAEKPGGRLIAIGLSGGVFKKTNLIESPMWGIPAFLISVILLLTGLIQLRPKAAPHLRQLAGKSLLGFGLVLLGILAEWQWGVTLGIGKGSIVLPAVWRIALHVGVVLLVWQAIQFFLARGTGIGKVAYAHGAIIALASLAVVVTVVAWRTVGAFPPYFTW